MHSYSPSRLHQVALSAHTRIAATRALEMRVQGMLAPRRAQAEQALHQIQRDPQATEAQRMLAQAKLRSLDAEINAVAAEIDRLAAPTAQADRLLTRCRAWIVQAQAIAR